MGAQEYKVEPLGDVSIVFEGKSIGVIKREQGAGMHAVFKAERMQAESVPKYDPNTGNVFAVTINRFVVIGWFGTFDEALEHLIQSHRDERNCESVDQHMARSSLVAWEGSERDRDWLASQC